jgi:hypothetical protein
MLQGNPMDEDRETIVTDIKDRIEKGEYRVDTRAVADAIICWMRALAAASSERVTPPRNPQRSAYSG